MRASALRALTAVDPNRALLEEKLDLEASIVRATAQIGLIAIDQGNGDGLIPLLQSDDDAVQREALRAMEAKPNAVYLPYLLPLLGDSDLREPVRRTVAAIGPEALEALDEALGELAEPEGEREVGEGGPDQRGGVLVVRLDELLADLGGVEDRLGPELRGVGLQQRGDRDIA